MIDRTDWRGSVARPVVELNYKDMGALPFVDNSLWPLVVYYAGGLIGRDTTLPRPLPKGRGEKVFAMRGD